MAIGLFIAAIIVALSIWAYRKHQANQAAYQQRMQMLGFRKMPLLEEPLRFNIEQLVSHRGRKVKFGDAYCMARSGYSLFRADIEIGRSDSGKDWRFFIKSEQLDLPRLAVMPNVQLPGILKKMFDGLINRLLKDHGLVPAKLPPDDPFGKKYLLFMRPEAAGSLPPADFWHRYAELPPYISIEAAGDLIFFGRNPSADKMTRPLNRTEEELIRDAIDIGGRLHDLFSRHAEVRS